MVRKALIRLDETTDTYPKILKVACERWGNRIALRQKDYGRWKPYTWDEYYYYVKYFSLGLISLGLQPGEKVSIVGDNEVPWLWAMLAVQAARGIVSTGLYADSLPTEFDYQLNHSDSTFAVVEDQEQVDNVLEVRDKVPRLRKIIYWDPKGLRNYNDPFIISFDEVLKLGKEYEKDHPGLFEKNVAEGKGEDLAFIAYTSGTTGNPKGGMMPFIYMINEAKALAEHDPSDEKDEFLSFTPLAWPMDVKTTFIRHLWMGGVVNFPEEPETVQENMREIGFSMACLVPRILESLVRMVQVRVSDADWLKRAVYAAFIPVGYKMADFRIEHKEPNLFWKILNFIGYWILFRPIQDKIGLMKAKVIWTGGAAVSPDTFRFILALGVTIKQLYGSLEAGINFVQSSDEIKVDTAGRIFPGTEMRISEEGELLLKTPYGMSGYYKNPEATEKYFAGGWKHSGDAAYLDEDCHLVVIDRVVDLMALDDGTRFSPMFIENKLKFCPYIKDAIIVGDGRPYVGALISIDYNYVGKWAENHHIPYTTYIDLSQKPEVYDLIIKEVKKVNKRLPEKTKIKRMGHLYKELDADDAELTRSAKLRRGFVGKRYHDIIEALYAGVPEHVAKAEITYADGKKKTIETVIKLVTLEE